MSDTAIKVEDLSKRYIIGKHINKDDGLRHVIQRAVGAPFRWASNGFRTDPRTYEEFWALKDLNFEVGVGEVVGIVGRNGAGKSTLLKVLSRITEQTQGRITLRGRMASLLEVGTGFHPELTGRENIYLNGAVLGMSRGEIKRKFDEIVAFAEVEKFLDTPVKRYSSGMYVRLAFAVAAHLEPEILVVDEVLAVGDMEFQRKCLGKMDEVSKEGRTVLFVSHNMATISRLCDRSIMLHHGKLIEDGPTQNVIERYLAEGMATHGVPLVQRTDRTGTGDVRLIETQFLNKDMQPCDRVATGQPLTIRLKYQAKPGVKMTNASVLLVIRRDEQVFTVLSSNMVGSEAITIDEEQTIDFYLPEVPFTGGNYVIEATIEDAAVHDNIQFGTLEVVDGDYYGTGRIRPNHHWKNVGVLLRHECKSVQFEKI